VQLGRDAGWRLLVSVERRHLYSGRYGRRIHADRSTSNKFPMPSHSGPHQLLQTLVINSPQGLRAANENVCPPIPSCDSRNDCQCSKQVIRHLWSQLAAILKPLGNKAGERILYLTGRSQFQLYCRTQYAPRKGAGQTYSTSGKGGRQADYPAEWQTNWCLTSTGSEFRNNMAAGAYSRQDRNYRARADICV